MVMSRFGLSPPMKRAVPSSGNRQSPSPQFAAAVALVRMGPVAPAQLGCPGPVDWVLPEKTLFLVIVK